MSSQSSSAHTSIVRTSDDHPAARFARAIWPALGGDAADLDALTFSGAGSLPSVFAVSDLAAATVGTAALALAELVRAGSLASPSAATSGPELGPEPGPTGTTLPLVQVDRRLASFWFGTTLRPMGWTPPPLWDAIAGNYRTADGWIRLHTNAPHHRDAALAVLGVPADPQAVARAVAKWEATALESAIVERKGCAAAMRSIAAWADHPQGRAVNAEPLVHRSVEAHGCAAPSWHPGAARPLAGVRVLDLTRVLAGPTATRFLAGFGAQVLRIDPHGWEEPGAVPEVVLGKRCARLDLKTADGRAHLERLLAQADVMVHGYRADALARLGLDAVQRCRINPALVDVSLDAYGWSGPWQARRGFDSLVQMSSGIADAGMRAAGADHPVPLPVQAIDHATGYLMAAAALRGLTTRLTRGTGSQARVSLARTAHLLIGQRIGECAAQPSGAAAVPASETPLAPEQPEDLSAWTEQTGWGPARRIAPPALVAGSPMSWELPAGPLGSAPAEWW